MENKKTFGWLPFACIAFLLGVAVFREFDFEQLSFKKPAMGILYLTTFISSVFLLFRGKKASKQ